MNRTSTSTAPSSITALAPRRDGRTGPVPQQAGAAGRVLATTALAFALATGGASAFAQAAPAPTPPAATTAGAGMDIPRITEHVSGLGYTDIREVERKSDKLYEIKARDRSGQRVEILVDSRSGEVLRSERD